MIQTLIACVASLSLLAFGAEPAGKIADLQGSAWRVEGSKREALKQDSPVFAGDVVKTDAASQATVLLANEAALLVKASSEIKIDHPGAKNWNLQLKSGSVLSSVKHFDDQPVKFKLRTRSAIMGVRGTTFFARDEGKGKPMFFCPCEGKLEVGSTDGKSSETFTSKHHDAPRLIEDKGSKMGERLKTTPPGLDFGHSDEDGKKLSDLLTH